MSDYTYLQLHWHKLSIMFSPIPRGILSVYPGLAWLCGIKEMFFALLLETMLLLNISK